MGSEGASGLWGVCRDRLGRYGVLKRIENGVELGTPDVAYVLKVPARPAASGWIELKHLSGWPKRPGTALNIPHLTVEQVVWLEGWEAVAGGGADLLLQVGPDYCFFDATGARALYERQLTKATALMTAHVVGTRRFPHRELVRHLTRNRTGAPILTA